MEPPGLNFYIEINWFYKAERLPIEGMHALLFLAQVAANKQAPRQHMHMYMNHRICQ